MFHSVATSSVYLSPSAADVIYNSLDINLIGVSPFLVNFYPQNILTDEDYNTYKPHKIVYNFGDSSEIVTKTLEPSLESAFNYLNPEFPDLAFPKEPGDPRNFPISHLYSITDSVSTVYKGSITVKWFADIEAQTDYLTYNLNISVLPPTLRPASLDYQGLFSDVHLHSIRMFGTNDTVLYNFESAEPNFLMPVIVKWPTYKQDSTIAPANSLPPQAKYTWRGYTLKAPFER
jgi:hypothetical protein